MEHRILSTILITTFLSFCALYLPQPLLPLLSQKFAIPLSQATLLISATLLPLSIAPIVYGYILESFSALTLLRTSILLLSIAQLPFLFNISFEWLLLVRFLEGLLLPAIFTALTTFLAQHSPPQTIRKIMGYYVAATIAGGFGGRLLSGITATYLHWHVAFFIIFVGLFISWFLLKNIVTTKELRFSQPKISDIQHVLLNPVFNKIYAIIFLSFFCFASVLNVLPFRVNELIHQSSTLTISLLYCGYLVGISVALNATRICRIFKGETRTIMYAVCLYFIALAIFSTHFMTVLFFNMFLLSIAMFAIHSILSGLLNQMAENYKAIANGVYISSYYLGGAVGSYFPAFIYREYGWNVYLLLLMCLMIVAGLFALLLHFHHNLKSPVTL